MNPGKPHKSLYAKLLITNYFKKIYYESYIKGQYDTVEEFITTQIIIAKKSNQQCIKFRESNRWVAF